MENLHFAIRIDGKEISTGSILPNILQDFTEKEIDNGLEGLILMGMLKKVGDDFEEEDFDFLILQRLYTIALEFDRLNPGKWYEEQKTILPNGVEIDIF